MLKKKQQQPSSFKAEVIRLNYPQPLMVAIVHLPPRCPLFTEDLSTWHAAANFSCLLLHCPCLGDFSLMHTVPSLSLSCPIPFQ